MIELLTSVSNAVVDVSVIAKLFLSFTAFAPVLVIYSVVSLMNQEYRHAVVFLGICVVLVLLCAVILHLAKRRLPTRQFLTETAETSDNEVFQLLLVYVLPLIIRDLSVYNWCVMDSGDGFLLPYRFGKLRTSLQSANGYLFQLPLLQGN